MAYRLGIIIGQYSRFSIKDDKNFSSTLDICILQCLLTSCITLLDEMTKNERKVSYLTADLETTNLWGINSKMIKENTFYTPKLTMSVILRRIRNALSHPSTLNLQSKFPSTGYTTVPDRTEMIHEYCFINSPDFVRNMPKKFGKKELGIEYLEKNAGDMPKDIELISDGNCSFTLSRNGHPFGRVFKMLLNTEELHKLVIELSNHLAQPIQENWNGITIERLVA